MATAQTLLMGMVTGEQRVNERFWVEQAVVLRWGDRKYEGKTVNMSLGGASIVVDLEAMPRIGDALHLTLQLPGWVEPVTMPGVVRWRSHGQLGVQFTAGFRARETYELTRFFRRAAAQELSA